MNNPDRAIELLIIDHSYDSAEGLSSTLRNAGIAIHPQRVDSENEIASALEGSPLDIVLCSAEIDRSELERNIDLHRHSTSDSALIVFYKEAEAGPLLQALNMGARDVVSVNDPEHLQFIVKREFGDLQTRRELLATRRSLQEAENRCSMLVEHSRDAIAYIHEGMHVLANPVYLELFGYVDMEELEGLPILDMIAPDDLKGFKKFIRGGDPQQGELQINCQNSEGTQFKAVLEFSKATIDGEPCTQIIIRDRSFDKNLEKKLEQVSNHDPQTGLYNRQYLSSRLDQAISDKAFTKSPLALLYIAIDEFQKIRTEIGIAASDSLLQQFSQVLKEGFGSQDLLARFGDHSFAVLYQGDQTTAIELADNIHKAVAAHLFKSEKGLLEPRCNIGIAMLNESVPSSQEFINNAYSACTTARTNSNQGTAVYDAEEMRPEFGGNANETKLGELIESALDNDGFKMVFQPVVSLQGESREFYAVLTRLIDENGDDIRPSQFMDAAVHAKQMARIDRWVIQNAVKELVSQRSKGQKVHFFVTLSADSLEDRETLIWICDCLREQQAKGAWLIFQIREADLRTHLSEAKELLDGLKKIKCQVAVDKYGVLSKSDTLLKHLPIDYVKFAPELVEEIAANQERQDKLVKLNTEVQGHGVKTIVMGVEDANSLAVLWTLGVNYIQGYFLQEPSENISYDFAGN